MNKELWQMTPKQYAEYRINQMYEKYGKPSKAEIKRRFGFLWFYQEFLNIIEEAAKEGKRIPNIVLDKLEPMNRAYILKYYDRQHRDYMPPEIREKNNQYEKRIRETRRKIDA